MAEPSALSSLSSPAPRPQPRRPRLAREIHHPSLRDNFDETLEDSRPPAPPAFEKTEYRSSSTGPNSAEHRAAERNLRGALLIGLLLNLAAFLGIGLSLPLGTLNRADALLGAVTLIAAVGLLVLGELCRRGGDPSSRNGRNG